MGTLPIVYHPHYSIIWPEAHRFPMTKFQMLHNYLLQYGMARPEQFHTPELVSEQSIGTVHDLDYYKAFREGRLDEKAARRIGMPWYPELVTRVRAEVGGTVATTRLALERGLACNTAGGTHHAYRDFGSGFCILNDLAVAAKLALKRVQQVLIVDLDVHQGDGTAAIFAEEPRVFTFSMHGARNFPFRKQTSDLDVGLPDGCDDETFMTALRQHLPELLERVQPDLIIYDAGVDVHRDDRLGRLSLSDKGLYDRDLFVLETAAEAAVPIACVVGGGYDDQRERLPKRHASLFQAATQMMPRFEARVRGGRI